MINTQLLTKIFSLFMFMVGEALVEKNEIHFVTTNYKTGWSFGVLKASVS